MSKKRGKSIKININLSNRWLYTLILIGILAIVAVGVYAATSFPASGAGHNLNELAQPCSNGQILKVSGGVWACGSDVDTDTKGSLSCITAFGSGTGDSVCASAGLGYSCTFSTYKVCTSTSNDKRYIRCCKVT